MMMRRMNVMHNLELHHRCHTGQDQTGASSSNISGSRAGDGRCLKGEASHRQVIHMGEGGGWGH